MEPLDEKELSQLLRQWECAAGASESAGESPASAGIDVAMVAYGKHSHTRARWCRRSRCFCALVTGRQYTSRSRRATAGFDHLVGFSSRAATRANDPRKVGEEVKRNERR